MLRKHKDIVKSHSLKFFKATLLCLLAVALLAVGVVSPAFAAGDGSITLNCSHEYEGVTTDICGDQYVLIQVADLSMTDPDSPYTYNYQTLADFTQFIESSSAWGNLSASESNDLAQEIANYAGPEYYIATATSDENGVVTFDNLEDGLYLIIRKTVLEDNLGYELDPFLVSVPYVEDGEAIYDVDALPKFRAMWDAEPGPDPVDPEPPVVPGSDPSKPGQSGGLGSLSPRTGDDLTVEIVTIAVMLVSLVV